MKFNSLIEIRGKRRIYHLQSFALYLSYCEHHYVKLQIGILVSIDNHHYYNLFDGRNIENFITHAVQTH